METGLVAKATA